MLPKNERISDSYEIKGILKRRKIYLTSPLLSLIGEENTRRKTRLVVSCSSKIGGAVARNRTRRLIMSGYNENKHKIAKNYDLVLLPRKAIKDQIIAIGIVKELLEKI